MRSYASHLRNPQSVEIESTRDYLVGSWQKAALMKYHAHEGSDSSASIGCGHDLVRADI
jgi:hypothetical protein